jgi:hypothetical protein
MSDTETFADGPRLTGSAVSNEPIVPKRKGPAKPAKPTEGIKRQRRGNSRAQLALVTVQVHLNGLYSQMNLLKAAMDDLTEALK